MQFHIGEIPMKYGFIIPRGDVDTIVAMAIEAEEAGWDGIYI